MVRLSVDDAHDHGLNVGGIDTPEAGLRARRAGRAARGLADLGPLARSVLNEARLLAGYPAFDQKANSNRPGVEPALGGLRRQQPEPPAPRRGPLPDRRQPHLAGAAPDPQVRRGRHPLEHEASSVASTRTATSSTRPTRRSSRATAATSSAARSSSTAPTIPASLPATRLPGVRPRGDLRLQPSIPRAPTSTTTATARSTSPGCIETYPLVYHADRGRIRRRRSTTRASPCSRRAPGRSRPDSCSTTAGATTSARSVSRPRRARPLDRSPTAGADTTRTTSLRGSGSRGARRRTESSSCAAAPGSSTTSSCSASPPSPRSPRARRSA